MATFTSTQAAAGIQSFKAHGEGLMQFAFGELAIAANPVAADLYELCKVPAGAVVVGGQLYASDMDTGTETLDLDAGWAANGGSLTHDSLDADGLGNWGVWTGDAFAAGNVSNVVGISLPLAGILVTGVYPKFSRETTIQLTCVVTAATFAAGNVAIRVQYYVDDSLAA